MPPLGHLLTLECRTAQLLDAAKNDDVTTVSKILDEDSILSVSAVQWTPRRLAPQLGKHWPAWGAQPGATALLCAAEAGSIATVEALLARGAPPEETTRYGVSALHLAALGGHAQVVSLLLATPGVEVQRTCTDMFDVCGPSALHFACCCEKTSEGAACVALLLKAGADPHQRCLSTGRTALHYAASQSNAAACGMLVRSGAWVQAADAAGETPSSLLLANLQPARAPAAAAAAAMAEMRWIPAVRMLWLGQLSSSTSTAPTVVVSGEPRDTSVLAAAGEEVEEEEDRCLLHHLTRDTVRLISDLIVESHAPPDAPPQVDAGSATSSVDKLSLAELSQAVRILHDSAPAPGRGAAVGDVSRPADMGERQTAVKSKE